MTGTAHAAAGAILSLLPKPDANNNKGSNMRSKILGLLAAGLLAGPMASVAATATVTYQGEAGGFAASSYPGLPSPFPTVEFAFTMTFDPLFSTVLGSAAVEDYTGTLEQPAYGPWLYQYNAVTKRMTIGDNCLVISLFNCGFTLSVTDAIFVLDLTDFGNPLFVSLVFRATGTYPADPFNPDRPPRTEVGDFRTSTGTVGVDGGGGGGGGTPVPEPGTLALLGLGLAGLGLSRRRKAA